MDTSRASEILNSIDPTSPNVTTPKIPTKYHRVFKQKTKQISSNPTIKYFQSISKRRLSSPTVHITEKSRGSCTYLPFDKPSLISRIQTFQKYTNWNISSSLLTPLIASRHGWCCFPKNELRCTSCSARLSIKIPQGLSEEDEDEILAKVYEKYVEQLVKSHKESCAWRKQWTPIEVYEIGGDYKELKIVEELYKLNLSQIGEISVNLKNPLRDEEETTVRNWFNKNGITDLRDDILRCSLLGWKCEVIGSKVMLISETCGRRVFIGDEPIDLIDEHHDWCCYVNGYKDLIKMMDSLIAKKVEIPTDEDDVNNEGSVQDTLDRLDKLRKLYFD